MQNTSALINFEMTILISAVPGNAASAENNK
jgi:hypothetical protein